MSRYIKWFRELGIGDVDLVGGKNASLGEMYRELSPEGIPIPNGFAITAEAYTEVLHRSGAREKLARELEKLDPEDVASLQACGKACREIVTDCALPDELTVEIAEAYETLKAEYGDDVRLAVRSSATAEDSPEASFAGQNDTYLNISSLEALLDAYHRCLASNFTDRSIHYKYDHGFDYLKVHLSVVVMKMVRSDMASSGVMFSVDTETGFDDVVFINSAYGLGENVVQGSIEPDSFYVHKPTYQKGYRAVLRRKLGTKALTMVLSESLSSGSIAEEYTENISTPEEKRTQYSISDEELMQLAGYAITIEKHYSAKAGHSMPMDMEWAKDGIDGKLYIVQARPETVTSKQQGAVREIFALKEHSEVLAQGRAVGTRIGSGKVRKVDNVATLHDFAPGDVLVARTTSPDWEPIMKIASAIITDTGGRTCHAAIVSRELGIPAIVGAKNAFDTLAEGSEVTVSCAEGEAGFVYEGALPYEVKNIDLSALPSTRTQIMMNLGNPDLAFSMASLPVDGIGLARMEFVIATHIAAHPMALLHPERTDETTRSKLDVLIQADRDAESFFIRTLSEGVATIASSVYPNPCVVRTSDFKTNEYAALLGGRFFEAEEPNPMIGFRGAARYVHPNFSEAFALECRALKRVREAMGFANVIIMIPFCRRVEEARRVIEMMKQNGLVRGENGLKVYMMCEIPNNVISIDAFSDYFDGFSIGSNDLTQLTLGVDRDNEVVAESYDERDEGVQTMIRMAVEGARRNGRHSGICGQAPSDYPEMAVALVGMGIDSMSLNPDSVLAIKERISALEAHQDSE